MSGGAGAGAGAGQGAGQGASSGGFAGNGGSGTVSSSSGGGASNNGGSSSGGGSGGGFDTSTPIPVNKQGASTAGYSSSNGANNCRRGQQLCVRPSVWKQHQDWQLGTYATPALACLSQLPSLACRCIMWNNVWHVFALAAVLQSAAALHVLRQPGISVT